MATPPKRAIDLIADEPLTAYVASSSDGDPHVTPVWYACQAGRLEFFAGDPLLADVRANPTVAVTVPTDEPGYDEWHIPMRGSATVVDDVDRINETAARLFPKYLGDDRSRWGVGEEKHTRRPEHLLVVVESTMRGSLPE